MNETTKQSESGGMSSQVDGASAVIRTLALCNHWRQWKDIQIQNSEAFSFLLTARGEQLLPLPRNPADDLAPRKPTSPSRVERVRACG